MKNEEVVVEEFWVEKWDCCLVGLGPKVWVHGTIPLTKLSNRVEGMGAATITSNSFVSLCLDFVRFGLNLDILSE